MSQGLKKHPMSSIEEISTQAANWTHALRDHFQVPHLNLFLSTAWSSDQPEYRLGIRKHLQQHIWNAPDALDLTSTPDPTELSISISHCRGLGGIFWSTNPNSPQKHRVGFDVELDSRCVPKALLRVSSKNELNDSPSAAALWTAKEAAFKTLPRKHQPPSVSLLKVGYWVKNTRHDFWQWQILSAQNDNFAPLSGITICQYEHTFSFCLKSFTT